MPIEIPLSRIDSLLRRFGYLIVIESWNGTGNPCPPCMWVERVSSYEERTAKEDKRNGSDS